MLRHAARRPNQWPLADRASRGRKPGDAPVPGATPLILETTFETDHGSATLVDFIPIPEREDRVDLVRLVRCTSGSMTMRTEFILRFGYGREIPRVRRTDYGLRAMAGPDACSYGRPFD
jgi:hypothetical protein